MKITFLGVGSASDPNYPNVSIFVEARKAKLLLDCGTTITYNLLSRKDVLLETDAIYISHRHADHYFGLPTVLLRMNDDGRKKPLAIIGYSGTQVFVKQILKLAYSTLFGGHADLGYPLEFLEFEKKKEFRGLKLELAPSIHPEINHAIKITEDGKSIAYSGDGMFTPEGERMYAGCDLLIHESYSIDEPAEGHAMAADIIRMAKERSVKAVALVHFGSEVRKEQVHRLRTLIKRNKANAFAPEPGTIIII